MQDIIADFEKYLYYNEKSFATIEKYKYTVKELFLWLGKRELTKETLLEYRRFLTEKLQPRTVNTKLSAINSYLQHINRTDIKVKFVKVQHRPFMEDNRQLTEIEYKKILDVAKSKKYRLYMIMITLCSTGIRISELKYITVEAVEGGKANVNMKGKYRTIILNKELCKKLKKYICINNIKTGHIFRTRSGQPVDRSNIYHQLKKLALLAGVSGKKVFPHNFRHLFARKFYQIEKNLAHLADVLGHSKIETTRIYVATDISTHQMILNKMKLVI